MEYQKHKMRSRSGRLRLIASPLNYYISDRTSSIPLSTIAPPLNSSIRTIASPLHSSINSIAPLNFSKHDRTSPSFLYKHDRTSP
ncbi:hypothetical protein ACN4EE_09420 [Geminocystis sp. CENA526]|uniref:hypothetical protein n=1 Tax=Geminocystis sp. CENA526 TaxID=1355871 RepID=UPI003D6FB3DD